MKKLLMIAAVALLAFAPAAGAQGYGDDDFVTTSDSTVVPGQPVNLAAGRFVGVVTFDMTSTPVRLGTAVADANGIATLRATIPANTTPGQHTIHASGTGIDGQPLTVTSAITVAAARAGGGTGAGGGTLPTTGSNSSVPMTQVAVGAIAAGGLMVLLAKRRSGRNQDAAETVGA